MKIALAIAFLILSFTHALAAERWPDAYARRNFKLGMALTDFKAAKYPDDKPGAYSVCSNETKSGDGRHNEAKVFSPFYDAGVIKCAFYQDKDNYPYDIGVELAGLAAFTYFYFIAEDEAEPVLFWINTTNPTAAFDPLLPVMEKAYGRGNRTQEVLQNGLGNKFTNDIMTWTKPESKIVFKRFGANLQQYSLDHTLLPMMNVLKERIDLQNDADASKL